MKRILLMVFRNLFFVPYGWFKLCWYASHAERYSEEQRYQLLKYVDNRAVKGGSGKKRADKRTISEAGICMHESVYD